MADITGFTEKDEAHVDAMRGLIEKDEALRMNVAFAADAMADSIRLIELEDKAVNRNGRAMANSTSLIEVPLLGHDKEEDVILQPVESPKSPRRSVLSRCSRVRKVENPPKSVEDSPKSCFGVENASKSGVSRAKEADIPSKSGFSRSSAAKEADNPSKSGLSRNDIPPGTLTLAARKAESPEESLKSQSVRQKRNAGIKRKFQSDEKENMKVKAPKHAGSSSDEDDRRDGKMMELESIHEKSQDVGSLLKTKRATRKQKRVQLKQIISSSDSVQHTTCEGVGSKRAKGHASQEKPSLKQKTKQKSVKFLLDSTDHIWGSDKTPAAPSAKPPQEWREINLDKVNPVELIGRSCRIFWPLDKAWYDGAIREYNTTWKKHRIDYYDNDTEWLCLLNQKVQFQITAEEEKTLFSAYSDDTSQKSPLDLDELVLLARERENFEEQIGHGAVVWAKVKGWSVWPALVLDEEHAVKCGLEVPSRKSSFAVQFFGSCDFARLNADKIVPFAKGVTLNYHTKCKRPAFDQGLREVERYLKQGRLPEKMAQMVEVRSNELYKGYSEESDTEDERENPIKTAVSHLLGFPLDLGVMKILSLGKIVVDSDHFHNKHYIWPEGYTSVRSFTSLNDSKKLVDYRMEVVRSPSSSSLPLFRVTPADGEPFEGHSAGDCWNKIYRELDKTMKKSESRKRKSGLSMFGFNNPRVFKLIQGLPNARACSNFVRWDRGNEENTPPGYKPVDVQWKHLERCHVCYIEEEYEDNLLLQCARCRLMVHMMCYGEMQAHSDGFWLCKVCQQNRQMPPPCCLCPVTGGAMKQTTDNRWAHLTCAMWIPETCLVDVKAMEPIDRINSVHKERWRLLCCVCRVPYGACIQCSNSQCMVSYHPLCARAAGFSMEFREKGARLQLLSFCPKHRKKASDAIAYSPSEVMATVKQELSGCSRCQPYNPNNRRKRQEPEAQALATSKRQYVQATPYLVGSLKANSCRWRLEKLDKVYRSIIENDKQTSSLKDDSVYSMSERLESMRSTMHRRLTFGKSGIHGWGIFAKQMHHAGDMMVEYAGEIVRPNIADIREQRLYNTLVGAGTYMFWIDDERVVDATHAGSIAHLINHSCEPNCYSRVITVDGKELIIIFAKRDILAGEELTYDYRLNTKGEELICHCGAAKCRGSVRSAADDSEYSNRILVPRSSVSKWIPP